MVFVLAWGNCALTFQRKIVTLQKRALRLIYFCKSKEHTVLFFLKSKCLPLPRLFFKDCSYLLYDINRQTAPVYLVFAISLLKQVRFIATEQDLSLATHFMLSSLELIKCMYSFFSRIGAQIWNSIPYSIKLRKHLSLRKKIKELLLYFLLSVYDYFKVSCLIKLFNTLG